MGIEKYKQRLEQNEIIEFSNGEDLAQIGKPRGGYGYLFIFNAKPLFSYKNFKTFERRVVEKINQYRLNEVME